MRTDDAVHAVAIGERQTAQTEPLGFFNQRLRRTGPFQEGVVTLAPERYIGRHGPSLHASVQEPLPPAAIVEEPQQIAALGFGEVVLPVDLAPPPATAEHVGTDEPHDRTRRWSHGQPARVPART